MRSTITIFAGLAALLIAACSSSTPSAAPSLTPTARPTPAPTSSSPSPSPTESRSHEPDEDEDDDEDDATPTPSDDPTEDDAPAAPEITRFDAPARLTCADPVSELVTIRYRAVRAAKVRFELDRAALSSRPFPAKGAAAFDLPCDGESHVLGLLAFAAGADEAGAEATRVVRAPR